MRHCSSSACPTWRRSSCRASPRSRSAPRHLLPNLATIILAQATVAFGYALVDLAALSYLGLGVDQASPDWGLLVASGQSDILAGHPEQSLYAAVLIVVAVAAFCLVGERITDREHQWRRR